MHKPEYQLPPKISLHPKDDDFINNTMPCLLPHEANRYGVKIVSRVKGRTPALKSDSMLYDVTTGELLAVIDCDYITTMRTGAVAALAVDTEEKLCEKDSIDGTWQYRTGNHDMSIFSATLPDGKYKVCLLKYKNQAEQFIEHFNTLDNFHFTIANDTKELFEDADVIISCITQANGLFIDDVNIFKPSVLVVPVHTRGVVRATEDSVFPRHGR